MRCSKCTKNERPPVPGRSVLQAGWRCVTNSTNLPGSQYSTASIPSERYRVPKLGLRSNSSSTLFRIPQSGSLSNKETDWEAPWRIRPNERSFPLRFKSFTIQCGSSRWTSPILILSGSYRIPMSRKPRRILHCGFHFRACGNWSERNKKP